MLSAIVFCACLAYTLYVLFGYPLLAALISRRRERPVHRGSGLRTVSVVLAVHNGERFLREKLESLLALDYPADLVEILVISDGSTDETEAIARGYASRGVRLLTQARAGKPAALNRGIAACNHEILFFTDVRQRLDRESLARLVSAFDDPEVGVVSGELIILRGQTDNQESVSLYRRYENQIRRYVGRIDSVFGATGCIYAMRRELAVRIPENVLLDDMYLPLAAFFRGYRLIFDESARAYDYPTTLDAEFSRKVRTLAGNYQIIRAFPQLLGPGNRMWFHFVSYKFARLLLPWVLLAMVCASFFLPQPWVTAVLGLQAIALLLTLLDPILPDGLLLKRVTSPLHTFFGLMAASACAVAVVFVPPRKLWKETRVASPDL